MLNILDSDRTQSHNSHDHRDRTVTMAMCTVIYKGNSTTTGVQVDRKQNSHYFLPRPTKARHIYIYIYKNMVIFYISRVLLHVLMHLHQLQGDALRHVGVFAIYQILIYIRCAFVDWIIKCTKCTVHT
jgi:hypothetical protein